MSPEKKTDKNIVYFIVGGAILGAIAGYIVKKVGIKNILNALKAKKIISESIADTISEFASQNEDENLEEEE
ncbi:MAG: hypothetical protein NC935_07720 [Candidatus Omnitrophica bacterium]|nr:hypothetical protein [Candidatus Omnitrophota bacterium]